jgi:hypothetical protein
MVPNDFAKDIRPKRIERSHEIYKAVAADAAACGMTPKQFAEHFMEQGVRELRAHITDQHKRTTVNLRFPYNSACRQGFPYIFGIVTGEVSVAVSARRKTSV